MGGKSGQEQSDEQTQEQNLEKELSKQKQQQKEQLTEATQRRESLLRRQLGGAGSLIPSQQGASTLGG